MWLIIDFRLLHCSINTQKKTKLENMLVIFHFTGPNAKQAIVHVSVRAAQQFSDKIEKKTHPRRKRRVFFVPHFLNQYEKLSILTGIESEWGNEEFFFFSSTCSMRIYMYLNDVLSIFPAFSSEPVERFDIFSKLESFLLSFSCSTHSCWVSDRCWKISFSLLRLHCWISLWSTIALTARSPSGSFSNKHKFNFFKCKFLWPSSACVCACFRAVSNRGQVDQEHIGHSWEEVWSFVPTMMVIFLFCPPFLLYHIIFKTNWKNKFKSRN